MKRIQGNSKRSKAVTIVIVAAALGVFTASSAFGASVSYKNERAVEPHEHYSEVLCCDDDLRENDLDVDCQILVANKNPLVKWVCSACGQRQQRAKSAGRPAPGKCPRKKNGAGHSWVRD